MPDDREQLGRIVREAWVAWACEQPDPKPSWLAGWDELDDGQREADMRIGAAAAAAERERIAALADSVKAVATADEGTQCFFADLIRDGRRIVSVPGLPDLTAEGNGPLLDPDCRDGKHASCLGAPCECPVPGVHTARHQHERSQP